MSMNRYIFILLALLWTQFVFFGSTWWESYWLISPFKSDHLFKCTNYFTMNFFTKKTFYFHLRVIKLNSSLKNIYDDKYGLKYKTEFWLKIRLIKDKRVEILTNCAKTSIANLSEGYLGAKPIRKKIGMIFKSFFVKNFTYVCPTENHNFLQIVKFAPCENFNIHTYT